MRIEVINSETNDWGSYHSEDLDVFVIGGAGGIQPGRMRLILEVAGGEEIGTCTMEVGSGDQYTFVVVPEGVAVAKDGYEPTDANELKPGNLIVVQPIGVCEMKIKRQILFFGFLTALLLSGCSFVRIQNVSDTTVYVNVNVPDSGKAYTRIVGSGQIVDVFSSHGGRYTVTIMPNERLRDFSQKHAATN